MRQFNQVKNFNPHVNPPSCSLIIVALFRALSVYRLCGDASLSKFKTTTVMNQASGIGSERELSIPILECAIANFTIGKFDNLSRTHRLVSDRISLASWIRSSHEHLISMQKNRLHTAERKFPPSADFDVIALSK